MEERGTLPKIVRIVREKPEAFRFHIENVVSLHVARCAVLFVTHPKFVKNKSEMHRKTVWMTAAASGQQERLVQQMLTAPEARSSLAASSTKLSTATASGQRERDRLKKPAAALPRAFH